MNPVLKFVAPEFVPSLQKLFFIKSILSSNEFESLASALHPSSIRHVSFTEVRSIGECPASILKLHQIMPLNHPTMKSIQLKGCNPNGMHSLSCSLFEILVWTVYRIFISKQFNCDDNGNNIMDSNNNKSHGNKNLTVKPRND